MTRPAFCVALAMALSACGGAADDEAATEGQSTAPAAAGATGAASLAGATGAASLAAAPAAFAQCRSCHSVDPGQHGVGPSLFGIYGTKAGELAGYTFSDALKGSGLTWDDATLDKWLESPARTVPGTKMVFVGMPDAAKRKDVIEYMKALK